LSAIPDSLDQLRVPIDSVKPHGRNPRRGDVKEIVRSLRHHGQYRPIVVNSRTSEVLAGNHTLEAARALGWDEIAATFVDVDDDQAARIVLIDNRSNDLAGYDDAALTELLASLPDLEGTGYSPQDLTELLGRRRPDAWQGHRAQAAAEEAEGAARRRLRARRSPPHLRRRDREPDARAPARGANTRRLIYTDPPYGISYQAFDRKFDVHRGRRPSRRRAERARERRARARSPPPAGRGRHLRLVHLAHLPRVRPGPRGRRAQAVRLHRLEEGARGPGLGALPARARVLPALPARVEGDHDLCLYCKGETWDGGRGQSDVWEVPRDTGYVHPTQKPVALAERALENSTRGGDLVLDMFGGSGSTLLACENLNRRARLLELDPGLRRRDRRPLGAPHRPGSRAQAGEEALTRAATKRRAAEAPARKGLARRARGPAPEAPALRSQDREGEALQTQGGHGRRALLGSPRSPRRPAREARRRHAGADPRDSPHRRLRGGRGRRRRRLEADHLQLARARPPGGHAEGRGVAPPAARRGRAVPRVPRQGRPRPR
jgi:hypothetical protein